MNRVLRKNGKLELITDNASYLGYHISIFGSNLHLGEYKGRGKQDRHYALYTIDHLKNFLKNLNLKIIKIEYLNSSCNWYVKVIRYFIALFSCRLAYPRIRVIAVKL